MICVCVGGNERERESIENLLFFTSFNMFFYFLKEIWKRRCVCGSSDEKELEKCRGYLFFLSWQSAYLYHTLQYQYNLNLNCNEQYKEKIDHDNSKLWGSNRSKL